MSRFVFGKSTKALRMVKHRGKQHLSTPLSPFLPFGTRFLEITSDLKRQHHIHTLLVRKTNKLSICTYICLFRQDKKHIKYITIPLRISFLFIVSIHKAQD